MTRFLAMIAMIFLFTTTVNANDFIPHPDNPMNGYWRSVSQSSERATTPAAFRQLQAKYPQLLGHVNADHITNAEVTSYIYAWEGTSSCSAGDPRLEYTSRGFSLCTNSPNGMGSCEASTIRMPPETNDPCDATNQPPASNWVEHGNHREVSEQPARISQIAAMYPRYFANLNAADLQMIEVNLQFMRWTGPTVCEANDPRLEIISGYAGYCFRSVNGAPASCAGQMSSGQRLEMDPCGAFPPR